MQKMEFILSLIIFLCGVATCLFSATFHSTWIAMLFIIPFTFVYLLFSKLSVVNVKLILCIIIIGYTVDSLLTLFGFMSFADHGFLLGQLPLWHFCCWILFATLFPTLFASVKNYRVMAIIGVIGGPLYYFSAHQLGTMNFHLPIVITMISFSVTWALLLCVFIKLKNTLTHTQSTIQAYD
jgi:hypothetical protein